MTNKFTSESTSIISQVHTEQPFFAKLGYDDLRQLTGRLLTIIDASMHDPVQRKATKDLIKQTIYFGWAEHLDRVDPTLPVGMPTEVAEQ